MKQRRLEQISPEEARDIAALQTVNLHGKNSAQRQRLFAGFRAMLVRQPSPCFKEAPTGIIPKTIRNKAARKSLFLVWTARATALSRFNKKREKQGLVSMDHVPLGNPGGWDVGAAQQSTNQIKNETV